MAGLYYEGYQIGKDAHYGPSDQHKDQYACDPFFKVGVLPKEVSRIEQESDKEDDPKDDGKDGTDGVRDIVDRILDAPDLGIGGQGGP
ncbi:hypothetical protein MTsPCn9_10570 [Croceitalea sp. MTPC9]|nr:hypothetical protein MTsPCn6_26670 [Croceitalea sp. MTPC6]GMN16121.1 hypothetical protein MTsPCn9_10570 [Croceitalea sp. MTPC9]